MDYSPWFILDDLSRNPPHLWGVRMKIMTIGALAESCGVRIDTVRYYEKMNLIFPVGRTESGYRQYSHESVRRLRFIRKAQDLGFKLGEVKDLLSLSQDDSADCGDIRDKAKTKVTEIERKIADLNRMRKGLVELSDYCPGKGKPLEDCGILAYFYEDY